MNLFFRTAISVGLILSVTTAWAQDKPIGSVKTTEGQAKIIRQKDTLDAVAGMKLLTGDILRTGEDGSLGVVLRDDSVLSLGPDSELALQNFLFSPAHDQLEFNPKLLKGSAIYQSGEIGKLSPEKIRFETPVATIGIRGTRFGVWVGPDK